MKTILILEDDIALSNGVVFALQTPEYRIKQFFTIKEMKKEELREADLLILDINLPDGSGLELLQKIRKDSNVKIILLTANDMETDIVTGLEMGADDYITKPFSLAVLRARVKTQLRDSVKRQEKDCYETEEFFFDFAAMQFQVRGEAVELSRTEQKLLRLLVENRGVTLPRELLIDRIWTDGLEYVDTNALSVSIKRLRDKLEGQAGTSHIKTVYGIGYVWEES